MSDRLIRALAPITTVLATVIMVAGAAGQESNPFAHTPVWAEAIPVRTPPIAPQFRLVSDLQKARAAQAEDDLSKPEALFQNYCTSCHDADRSLKKKKILADWRITVRKMAEKEDADIPQRVREPIAKFLADRAGVAVGNVPVAGGDTAASKEPAVASATDKDQGKKQADDSALIQQGKTAFETSCVTCHDAEKSLQQTKSLSAWRTTVRRMADKDGANIPENSHEAIATYLASLGNKGKGDKDSGGGADSGSPVSVSGTVSAKYRGSGDPNLEDPGHFGDAWVGVAWQPKGPVSARFTSCISCHTQGVQLGNIEVVEASLRLDVNKCICPNNPEALPFKTNVEAGRFVVPFGAYYQEVNPGVDRAVSPPLIYNMGQRVYPNSIGDPVLPMPFSDEGASLNVTFPIHKSTTLTFNSYVINGLEGNNSGIDFFQSRDYVDNNRWPSAGGRVTIGGPNLRLGTSVLGGRFNADTGAGPKHDGLNYVIFGADAVFHWKDILRVQFEYAQRENERYGGSPQPAVFSEHVSGYYVESELLILREHHVSLFTRYDWQLHESPLPPLGFPSPTGNFAVDRFTYGVNWTLPGGSLLMLNDEVWNLPKGLGTVNVVGARWAVSF